MNEVLIDLCCRLPYKVRCIYPKGIGILESIDIEWEELTFKDSEEYQFSDKIKPLLRSTITESEWEEYNKLDPIGKLDWANKNHFDYRGLIKKGLAVEII